MELPSPSREECIPSLVSRRNERLAEIVGPVSAGLGSKLVIAHRLPTVAEARAALERWMR